MNIFRRAYELEEENESFALVTLIETDGSTPRNDSAKMIVKKNAKTYGTIGGGSFEYTVIKEAEICIAKGESKILDYNLDNKERDSLNMICGGKAKVYIDVINSEPIILLLGGGHINYSISKYIDILNYKYIIIDNLKEMANSDRFPNAHKIINKDFEKGIKELSINNQYSVVVATRGHEKDYECIKQILGSNAEYIGMIGSKKKTKETFDRLKKEGFQEKLSSVNAPIGLDLGAQTPEEIGISIISEIMKIRNKATGNSLKDLVEERYEL